MKLWRDALGASRVASSVQAAARYGPGTEGKGALAGALFPASVEEVARVIRIANKTHVPVYPVSTGRNWGYGSAIPPVDGCVIVDLSRMNKITAFDAGLGLVTLQPGVTQSDLHSFLSRKKAPYLVSVNGAGGDTSVFGNILERGFENLPCMDRFTSLISLQAVLPSGEIYERPLSALDGFNSDKVIKWGCGPYLDGLFSQGNFGIVTQMTVALARIPERLDAFSFRIESDEALERFILAIRDLRQTIGPMMGLVRVVNVLRLLASVGAPYPHDQAPPGSAIPPELVERICAENKLPPWIGAGSILGPEEVVKPLGRIVKAKLGGMTRKLTFTTERFGGTLPASEVSLTRPRDVGLHEAYWKTGLPPKSRKLDPSRDGCGVLWYAPSVPLRLDAARAYIANVTKICRAHGIDPEASIIISHDHYFYGITPLIFRRDNDAEIARAHACWKALYKAGEKKGFVPYRAPSQLMGAVVDPSQPFWKFASLLKSAADPNGIVAPGRYAPVTRAAK